MSTDSEKAPAIKEGRIRVLRSARYFSVGHLSPDTAQIWFVCHGYRQSADRFVRRFAAAAAEGAFVVAPEALSRFYVDPAPGAHGPESRVGASWMTRVDREAEIHDYVDYLDALARLILESPERGLGAARPSAAAQPNIVARPSVAAQPNVAARPSIAAQPNVAARPTIVAQPSVAARPQIVALGFSQGGHTAARWAALGSARADALVLWGSHLPPDEGIAGRLADTAVVTVFGDRDPVADPEAERRQDQRLAAAGVASRRHVFSGGHQIDPGVVRDLARSFAC